VTAGGRAVHRAAQRGTGAAELLDAGAVAIFYDPADLLESTGGQLAQALPG
jgi:hypothetical protein